MQVVLFVYNPKVVPSLLCSDCEHFPCTLSRVFNANMLCVPSLTVVMCWLQVWIQLMFRKIFIMVTNLDQFDKSLKNCLYILKQIDISGLTGVV